MFALLVFKDLNFLFRLFGGRYFLSLWRFLSWATFLGLKKLFTFYSERLLKKDNSRIQNIGFNNAKLIGIIYKHIDFKNQKEISYFVKELKKTGKSVQTICYLEGENKDFDFKSFSFVLASVLFITSIIALSMQHTVLTHRFSIRRIVSWRRLEFFSPFSP